MVHTGHADGMVSGAADSTAHTITPSFEIIKTAPGVSSVSSVFFMCLADRVPVDGDCAVIPDPTVEELADIAVSSAATAAQFGVDPRVAMLSYSTGESGTGADVDKVRAATALVRSSSSRPVGRWPAPVRRRRRCLRWPRQSCRVRMSPAAPTSSSSPTSTPATTPTRPFSARPAQSPSDRSCRA